MPPIRNLRINMDMDGKKSIVLNTLTTVDKVEKLKQTIIDREYADRNIKGVKLIWRGKVLGDDTKTLAQCKIKSNSVLTCIVRLRGGTQAVTSGEGCVPELDEDVCNKYNIKLVKTSCQLGTSGDCCTSDGTKRIQMPECNYKCTYCYKCLKEIYTRCLFTYSQNTDVVCSLSTQCGGSTYDLDRIFIALQLDEKEQQICFIQLNKNYLGRNPNVKTCPGCENLVEKEGIDHNRVVCPVKSCKFGDWCFACQQKWKSNGSNYNICGNDDCESSQVAKKLDIIINCERKTMTGIKNVPTIRMCPMCERLCEHADDGCKHLTCTGSDCGHGFCASCLDKWYSCECENCKGDNTGCTLDTTCKVEDIQV